MLDFIKNFIKTRIIVNNKVNKNTKRLLVSYDLLTSINLLTKNCKSVHKNNHIERLYWIYNDMNDYKKCANCNNNVETFYSFLEGYSKFCGIKCSGSHKETIEVRHNTIEKKYGVRYFSQTESHRKILSEKQKLGFSGWANKEHIQNKYGVSNIMKISEYLNKSFDTKIKRYGKDNLDLLNFKYKGYTLPSGKIIKVQGYEPRALDELLKIYDENDILTSRSDMPEIYYTSPKDNRIHRYYPDIYIPKDNLIIEVKSNYTLNKYKKINRVKFEATIALGYDFKLKVYK